MALPPRVTSAILAAMAVLSSALAGCGDFKWPFNGGGSGTSSGKPAQVVGSGQWVIILREFSGADRNVQAERLASALRDRKWSGISAWHNAYEQRSYVCYGPFKLGKELDDNLRRIHAFQDDGGERPFLAAYLKEMPRPDPEARPGYNLANAPKWAYWSLQVMYFVDPDPAFPETQLMDFPANWDRKKAAVDACEELRAKGFEAYFYHGPKMSMITLGLFPAQVCRFINDPANPRYEGYNPDTDQYTDTRVQAIRNKKLKNPDGAEEAWFRYNLTNGRKIPRVRRLADGREIRTIPPSFLVVIPRPGHDIE